MGGSSGAGSPLSWAIHDHQDPLPACAPLLPPCRRIPGPAGGFASGNFPGAMGMGKLAMSAAPDLGSCSVCASRAPHGAVKVRRMRPMRQDTPPLRLGFQAQGSPRVQKCVGCVRRPRPRDALTQLTHLFPTLVGERLPLSAPRSREQARDGLPAGVQGLQPPEPCSRPSPRDGSRLIPENGRSRGGVPSSERPLHGPLLESNQSFQPGE